MDGREAEKPSIRSSLNVEVDAAFLEVVGRKTCDFLAGALLEIAERPHLGEAGRLAEVDRYIVIEVAKRLRRIDKSYAIERLVRRFDMEVWEGFFQLMRRLDREGPSLGRVGEFVLADMGSLKKLLESQDQENG